MQDRGNNLSRSGHHFAGAIVITPAHWGTRQGFQHAHYQREKTTEPATVFRIKWTPFSGPGG